MTGHGAPILGSRHTSVHYLSRTNGHLFSEVHSHPRRRAAQTSSSSAVPSAEEEAEGPEDEELDVDVRDILVMARVTHELEALNPVTQQVLWNVSHSAWRHTPLPGVGEMAVPLLDVSGGASIFARLLRCLVYRVVCLSWRVLVVPCIPHAPETVPQDLPWKVPHSAW
jgi:hypothetical protein